jgi:hypothetical protein
MDYYLPIAGCIAVLLFLGPFIVENIHRLYIPTTAIALLFFCLNGAAPYSPEARNILLMVHHVPETVIDALSSSEDSMTKLNSAYFTSFH